MQRQLIKSPKTSSNSKAMAKGFSKPCSPSDLAVEKTYLLKRAFWAYKLGKIRGSYSKSFDFSEITPDMKLTKNFAISPDFSREGFLLLLEAAHDWNPKKNPNFDAFAMLRLRQWKARTEIKERNVAYSFSLAQEINSFEGFFNHNPEATLDDFAKAKGIGKKRAENISFAAWHWNNSTKEVNSSKFFYSSAKEDDAPLLGLSFDQTLEGPLYDMCPDLLAEEDDISDKLELAFASLSKKEARVLKLRFGLSGGVEHTYDSAAEILKKSVSQIREIEKDALLKLASSMDPINFSERVQLMEKTESEREFVEKNESLLALLPLLEEFALRLNYGIGLPHHFSPREISFLLGAGHTSISSQIKDSLLQMVSNTSCKSFSKKKGASGVRPFLLDNKTLIEPLSVIQKNILTLRYGLGNKKALSGPKTAKALKNGEKPLSREAIRQKESEAIWNIFKATIEQKPVGALRKFIFQHSKLISSNLTSKQQKILYMLLEPASKRANRIFPNQAERVLLGSAVSKLLELTYVSKRKQKSENEVSIPKNRREFVHANSFLLSTLSPSAEMQLRLRYGMEAWSEHTHTQTMQALKLDSVSQTRKVISGALDELRKIRAEVQAGLDLNASIKYLLKNNLKVLQALPPKLEAAARLWSGAEAGKQHTSAEIASALNISVEHARYLQLRAYQFVYGKLKESAKKATKFFELD